MIWLFVSSNAVSFAAGLVAGGIIGAVLFHESGYRRGRRDALHDRTSRAAVRVRLVAHAGAPRPLPRAMRDHAEADVLHLTRIHSARKAGRS